MGCPIAHVAERSEYPLDNQSKGKFTSIRHASGDLSKIKKARCLGCGQVEKLILANIFPRSWVHRIHPPTSLNKLNRATDQNSVFAEPTAYGYKQSQSNVVTSLPVDSNILCGTCDGILGRYDDALYGI